MKELFNSAKFAFEFLCKCNPLDCEQSTYVFMLMDFQEVQGDEAIEALAGFYVWCIDNLKGDKCTHAIVTTFTHDLNGRNDKHMLPRSSDYKKYWDEEVKKYQNQPA